MCYPFAIILAFGNDHHAGFVRLDKGQKNIRCRGFADMLPLIIVHGADNIILEGQGIYPAGIMPDAAVKRFGFDGH